MTHRFGGRTWIALAAAAIVAAHLVVPYLLFRNALTIAAGSVLLVIVVKHVGAALTIWWANRRRNAKRIP